MHREILDKVQNISDVIQTPFFYIPKPIILFGTLNISPIHKM